jgi:hypothetical protein
MKICAMQALIWIDPYSKLQALARVQRLCDRRI